MTPEALSVSNSATDAALTLTFGPNDTGTTWLHNLVLSLAGGSAPVTVTLSGLMANHVGSGTAGEMVYVLPPNTILPLHFDEPLEGGPAITLSGTAGSGQTLAAALIGRYE